MEQLLTANVATNLYWLGRYVQRIEETLNRIVLAYDDIIDIDKDAGKVLYENFSIDLEYKNAKDFLNEAIFGEHSANLVDLSAYVRENGIICRNHLNTSAFGEIIALHDLLKNCSRDFADVDYNFIDAVYSLISEMWGEIAKEEHKNISNYFLKLGQLVEKIDFNFRFKEDKTIAIRLVERINIILEYLESETLIECREDENIDYEVVINDIHSKVESIIKY
jgi:uncharacterized alpha-E superfamily protein